MKANTAKRSKKAAGSKINKSLNALSGKNLFPEKLAKANALLKKSRLPKQ